MMAVRSKSWKELMSAIRSTFRKWGALSYQIAPQEPPRARNRHHSYGERSVTVRFHLRGRSVELTSNSKSIAHDNLALLALTLESLRLNKVREIEPLIITAYRQLDPLPTIKTAPPLDESDPYVILGVGEHYPLTVIETIWKARLRVEHPDAGGSNAMAIKLNAAMAEIRKGKG